MEEPLPAGGSCLLGSINLAEFVLDPFTPNAKIDGVGLMNTVDCAVRALNDVLDEGLVLHPLTEQQNSVRDWRQIGLGIMGLADMLIKLGVTYGSKKATQICDALGFDIACAAIEASSDIALEDNHYPKWNKKVLDTAFYQTHINTNDDYYSLLNSRIEKVGLANSQLLTIAPTGTLSTMLGISGGIEPIFANSYTRKTESLHGKDVSYKVYTPIVEAYMKANGITDESDLPEYFVTSSTIPYRSRIDMQAVWQKHIDASISSTVNLPKEATVDDVKDLYIYAWEQGLKGITIFRDGCKRAGILTTNTTEDDTDTENVVSNLPRGFVLDAADEGIGLSTVIHTGCGKLYMYVKFDPNDGEPYEVFVNKGSQGTCRCNVEGLARMTSYALRCGACIDGVVDQLQSVDSCAAYASKRAKGGMVSQGTCCPSAMGYALDRLNKQYKEMFGSDDTIETPTIYIEETNEPLTSTEMVCPECGEPLIHEGGCVVCKACAWSKCS